METSRRSRKKNKNQAFEGNSQQNRGIELQTIKPMTANQERAFLAFDRGRNLMLHGFAGTGKTFIALYLALKLVSDTESGLKKVVIIRSTVSSRDQGFMPGNQKEKAAMYEEPYMEAATKLYTRGDAYDILKGKGMVVFKTTSFLRGTTLDDAVVIVDECQNMADHELNTVITRLGENSKLIMLGDVRQDDLTNPRFKEVSGLAKNIAILKSCNTDLEMIEFQEEDIVRSKFVKNYIIARDRYERAQSVFGTQEPERKPTISVEEPSLHTRTMAVFGVTDY